VRNGKRVNATSGETLKVTNQWAAECQARDTTISSSAWESSDGTTVTAAMSGTTATGTFTPIGDCTLTNTVVLANGETLVLRRAVLVRVCD